jgi:hypothetical protein
MFQALLCPPSGGLSNCSCSLQFPYECRGRCVSSRGQFVSKKNPKIIIITTNIKKCVYHYVVLCLPALLSSSHLASHAVVISLHCCFILVPILNMFCSGKDSGFGHCPAQLFWNDTICCKMGFGFNVLGLSLVLPGLWFLCVRLISFWRIHASVLLNLL